ncbi:complex I NDUFA9 subunit family protein [Haloterrigena alkaliphila]|uniref:Complex I NDUFA9 subunit family protein n=1 Tax=Haloterrigena alkaliphila TaxID=2816475 RepID=A0A8A2V8T0_9EURY|nr:complex I NDUFA9 subunit family protein [Haloterrigena alkaliphila]QSW97851.1 complex I NDUFA9 subunit family protein [Haloterrigena alkaliphila]
MNVLVAGGTGFIGTNLCTELHERGHDVTALARDPSGAALPEGVERAAGDVSSYDSIADTVAGHDAVVNLVSLSPLYQPRDEGAHETVHLGGTENLVRAAEDGDADRFVQMSALGADPDADTEFLRTKGAAEAIVTDSHLAWTIVRPSVVFGDGAEFLEFTKQLTTPYVTGLPGGGKTRFQPVWVGDLVPMLADALEDHTHVGETYEIAGPQIVTLADATEMAYAADGHSVKILSIPMSLAKLGLSAVEPLPFVPFGADQARSLEMNNTVVTNDVTAFDVSEDELTTLGAYLGVDAADRRTAKRRSA